MDRNDDDALHDRCEVGDDPTMPSRRELSHATSVATVYKKFLPALLAKS